MSSLEKFIMSEIEKISKKENLNFILKEDKKAINECSSDSSCSCCQNKDSYTYDDSFNKLKFEDVNSEEIEKEIEEVKMISEELSRMKEILSFNNPFLK
jgi:ATP-dependent Lon protease